MQLTPRSSSAPLGTITVDSPLKPEEVIAHLGRGGWREGAIPEDLRKFKVTGLAVEKKGREFEMHWAGSISPLYNPVCFGIAQPLGDGSRLRAGFKLDRRSLRLFGLFTAMPIVSLMGRLDTFILILAALMFISVGSAMVRNRTSEPMRSRLIDVLTDAAKATSPAPQPFARMMSTNGP